MQPVLLAAVVMLTLENVLVEEKKIGLDWQGVDDAALGFGVGQHLTVSVVVGLFDAAADEGLPTAALPDQNPGHIQTTHKYLSTC